MCGRKKLSSHTRRTRNLGNTLFALSAVTTHSTTDMAASLVAASFILSLASASSSVLQPVKQIPIDISPLGRVSLTGNFEAVSLYEYQGQNSSAAHNATTNTTASSSILTPLPNGQLATLASADADILAMCPLLNDDGSIKSIVVGGNFTSLKGVDTTGLALFNPKTYDVTAIEGLAGRVLALYCDTKNDSVYVGGDFTLTNSSLAQNASNVAVWSEERGFSALPFGGFNSPVTSIGSTQNGTLVFGGAFDGFGNSSSTPNKGHQIINLSTADITSTGTADTPGYNDPKNIVCRKTGENGPGKTWLLQDNTPGSWHASMGYGFRPTKLRLWNTQQEGRGTKLFAFRALPDNGLLNMSYTDSDGKTAYCNPGCSLPQTSAGQYQEYTFVYQDIRMNAFQLEIWEWYGAGGGLDGIELLSDEINTYAVNDFNEPACADTSYGSKATTTGQWTPVESGQTSSSNYLKSTMDSTFQGMPPFVTFEPDIKESANYSISFYTPGCLESNSCDNRGQVNITYRLSRHDEGRSTIIYQTNEYEKYDHIFNGYVEAATSTFRPTVTLSGIEGSRGIDIVASFVRFEKISNMSHDLNGIFTYDPSAHGASIDTLTQTSLVKIGSDLDPKAQINAITTIGSTLLMGGNFTNTDDGEQFKDILSIDGDKAESLTDGGLDNQVNSLLPLNGLLYVGGAFKKTANGGEEFLNAAIYNSKEGKWEGLGAKGFNGAVQYVTEFPVNISSKMESAVAFTGNFTRIVPSPGKSNEISVPGFAVWVPSKRDWLCNVQDALSSTYYGKLTASIVMNDTIILAGSLQPGGTLSPGVVELFKAHHDASRVGIAKYPMSIDIDRSAHTSSSLSKAKRYADLDLAHPGNGPLTAVYYNGNKKNLTIFGGHFSAKNAQNKSLHNLVIINGSDDNKIIGLTSEIDVSSTFHSVAVQKDILFAGGNVTGKLNDPISGIIAFDLNNDRLSDEQPAALQGTNVVVNAIAPRDGSSDVYVGGHFQAAGGLPCPSVCTYQMDQQSWSRPGAGLDGTTNILRWANKTLIAAGNLTVNDKKAYIATYDSKKQEWLAFSGNNKIPGPVTSLILAKESGTDFWFSGVKNDGTNEPYVMHYDGTSLTSLPKTFDRRSSISDLRMIGIKEKGNERQALILLGSIEVPDFGAASAVILDPDSGVLHPFLLTTDADGKPAKINGFFSENENTFEGSDGKHSRGIVVLVSFCIALGCVFLIVLGGIIASRIRRRQQGYISAPQMVERKADLGRVPPAHLLNDLNGTPPPDGPGGTPMI